MKKRFLFFVLFIGFFGFCQNNKIMVSKFQDFDVKCDQYIGFDVQEYQYYINSNVFIKQKNDKIFEYKNLTLGKITKVDLQNPLNIVLFYENFNTVIILDNQLNEVYKINFSENEIPINAAAIGFASQNKLWIYNNLNQQIGLFDYLKNDYKTISTPLTHVVKFYQSDFNNFSWIDEKNTYFTIDVYGKISVLGNVPDFESFQSVANFDFIYLNENFLYYFDLKNLESRILKLDEKTIKNFYYKDQILSIFTNQEITNYKITIP